MQSGSPITIQDDFKTTVDVKFGQGTPFENDPVVPTLIQIAQVVEKTLDAFEGLIRATKRTC